MEETSLVLRRVAVNKLQRHEHDHMLLLVFRTTMKITLGAFLAHYILQSGYYRPLDSRKLIPMQ